MAMEMSIYVVTSSYCFWINCVHATNYGTFMSTHLYLTKNGDDLKREK